MMPKSPAIARMKESCKKRKASGMKQGLGYKFGLLLVLIALLVPGVNGSKSYEEAMNKEGSVGKIKDRSGEKARMLEVYRKKNANKFAKKANEVEFENRNHDIALDQNVNYGINQDGINAGFLGTSRQSGCVRFKKAFNNIFGVHGAVLTVLFLVLDSLYLSGSLPVGITAAYFVTLGVLEFFGIIGLIVHKYRINMMKRTGDICGFFLECIPWCLSEMSFRSISGESLKIKSVWMIIYTVQLILLWLLPVWSKDDQGEWVNELNEVYHHFGIY